MRITLLTLTLFASSSGCISAQHPSDHASSFAAGEPVAELDKKVWGIFQSRDGSHWFTSDAKGLYRYDGKTHMRYTTAHGLPSNDIGSIQEDRSGNIYIASGAGIGRYDGRTFTPLRVADPEKCEWGNGPDDLWWPGGQDSGVVYRYDGKILHRLPFPKTAPGEDFIARYPREKFPAMKYNPYDVYTIYQDSRGHLWFGTAILGAVRYDGKTFAWAAKTELGFTEDDAFGVRSIIEDREGKYWFSITESRFAVEPASVEERGNIPLRYRKEPGLPDPHDLQSPTPYIFFMSAVNDKNGDLWLSTLGDGVWRWDGSGLTHYPVLHEGKPFWIFSIYRDRDDVLWIGTHEHGAYKWNGNAFEQARFPEESSGT